MAGEIVRVQPGETQFNYVRPDGSRFEYRGPLPSEELTVIVGQLVESDKLAQSSSGIGYAQLLQWATKLQKLQPLILTAGFFVGCLALLFWATRPGDTYYQPQSQEVRYEWPT